MPKIPEEEIQRRLKAGWRVSGAWTYHAKDRIGALGGYWHPPTKAWLLPNRAAMLAALALQPEEAVPPAPLALPAPPAGPTAPPPPPPVGAGNPYSLPRRMQAEAKAANQHLESLESWWEGLTLEQQETLFDFIQRLQRLPAPPVVQGVPMVQAVQGVPMVQTVPVVQAVSAPDPRERQREQWLRVPLATRQREYQQYVRRATRARRQPIMSEDDFGASMCAGMVLARYSGPVG